MKTVPCRGCGRSITFIRSEKTGKNMPVDPELVSLDELTAGQCLVTDTGLIVKYHQQNVDSGIEGYIPHWISCPKADEFRAKRTDSRRTHE